MTQARTRTHTTIATTGPSSKPTDPIARVDSSSPLLTSNSQIPGGATGGVYYDTRAVNSETVALAPKSRFKLLKTKLKAIAIDTLLAARPQIWKDLSWHFNPPPTEYMTPAAHVDRAIRAPDVLPGRPEADERKRTIFVSACVDAAAPGGWRYNGGINEYNHLVRLLRSKGHDAYIVTFDGRL